MRVQQKAFGIITTLFIITGLVFYYFNNKLHQDFIKQSLQHNNTIYNSLIDKHLYHPLFYRVESMKKIHGEIIFNSILQKDRKPLQMHFQKILSRIKMEYPSLELLHFFDKDGITLLRITESTTHAEDLKVKRSSIEQFLQTKDKFVTYETDQDGLLFRVITPLFTKNNKFIGGIEIGVDIFSQLEHINVNISNVYALLFVKKDFSKDRSIKASSLRPKTTFENFKLHPHHLNSQFTEFLPPQLEADNGLHFIESDQSSLAYIPSKSIVLNNFKGEPVAKVVVLQDITNLLYPQSMRQINFLIVLASLFLLTIITAYYSLKYAFDKLNRSEQLHTKAQSVANLGHWELNLKTNQLRWSNQVFHLFGMQPNRSLQTYETFLAHIHPDDREMVNEVYTNSIKERKPYKILHRIIQENEKILYVEERGEHQFDSSGEAIKTLGTVQDVTDFYKTNAKLNELNESLNNQVEVEIEKRQIAYKEKAAHEQILVQQSKMATMGEMIEAIAHQWKQPLNAISLSIDNISDSCSAKPVHTKEIQNEVDLIQSQVLFMDKSINDFINFLKPTRIAVDFRVCETVTEAKTLLNEILTNSGVQVVVHDHEHFKTRGLPNELKHVICNILNNAREQILEKKRSDGKIEVHFESRDGFGIIRIQDNAGGISPEMLPNKIFEAYTSTKNDQGSGLGLRIAKILIENGMNGKIKAKNLGDGAQFTIKLPLSDHS